MSSAARELSWVLGRFVLVVALVLTICQTLPAAPAHADDPVVLLQSPPLSPVDPSARLVVSSTNVATPGNVVVSNPGGTAPTIQQCPFLSSAAGSFCLGTSDPQGTVADPVVISDAPSVPQRLPGDDMDWIVDEAVTAIAAVRGLRADDQVRAYARPEIRAYVIARLQGILNRKLYGQPLSEQEQAAYVELEDFFRARVVQTSAQALKEYDDWSRSPCTYEPPAPPPGSGLPAAPNPVAESSTCHRGGSRFALWETTRARHRRRSSTPGRPIGTRLPA